MDALIQLALLHQRKPDSTSQLAALNAYKDAYKALERSGRPKPPQLLANIATLLHRLGDTTAAMARYKQALEVMARAEVRTCGGRCGCGPCVCVTVACDPGCGWLAQGLKREEFMYDRACRVCWLPPWLIVACAPPGSPPSV